MEILLFFYTNHAIKTQGWRHCTLQILQDGECCMPYRQWYVLEIILREPVQTFDKYGGTRIEQKCVLT